MCFAVSDSRQLVPVEMFSLILRFLLWGDLSATVSEIEMEPALIMFGQLAFWI